MDGLSNIWIKTVLQTCFNVICFDDPVAYSMCGNLHRHDNVKQTTKMCLVVGGEARNNTQESHWREQGEITRVDELTEDLPPPPPPPHPPTECTNLPICKLPISY